MARPEKRLNNHVMWDAFARIKVDGSPLVGSIIKAMKRHVPGYTGGWRVIREGKSHVKRSR